MDILKEKLLDLEISKITNLKQKFDKISSFYSTFIQEESKFKEY